MGPGSAAGDSPGMAVSSAIRHLSTHILSRNWLAPRRIETIAEGKAVMVIARHVIAQEHKPLHQAHGGLNDRQFARLGVAMGAESRW